MPAAALLLAVALLAFVSAAPAGPGDRTQTIARTDAELLEALRSGARNVRLPCDHYIKLGAAWTRQTESIVTIHANVTVQAMDIRWAGSRKGRSVQGRLRACARHEQKNGEPQNPACWPLHVHHGTMRWCPTA